MGDFFANWTIEYHAMGEGFFVYKIFLAMTAFVSSKAMIKFILSLGGLSSLCILFFAKLRGESFINNDSLKKIFWVIFFVSTFGFKTNVLIIENMPKSGKQLGSNPIQGKAKNVPVVLALPSILVFKMGNMLSLFVEEKMTKFFKNDKTEILGLTEAGPLGLIGVTNALLKATPKQTILMTNLKEIFINSILPRAVLGSSGVKGSTGFSLQDLGESKNLIEFIDRYPPTDLRSMVYVHDDGTREEMGGKVAWARIKLDFTRGKILAFKDRLTKERKKNYLSKFANLAFESGADRSQRMMVVGGDSLKAAHRMTSDIYRDLDSHFPEVFEARVAICALQNAVSDSLLITGSAGEEAVHFAKALGQKNAASISGAKMFGNIVEHTRIALICLGFIMGMVLFPIFVLPRGIHLFAGWINFMVGAAMITPVIALVNCLMSLIFSTVSDAAISVRERAIAPLDMAALQSDTEIWMGVLSGLYCLAIGIAFYLGSKVFGFSKGVSPLPESVAQSGASILERVSNHTGEEIGAGNLSFGNRSYNNTSANKFDTVRSHRSGFGVDQKGAITSTMYAEGVNTKVDGLSANMQKTLSNDMSTALDKTQSMQNSRARSLSKTMDEQVQAVKKLAENFSEGESANKHSSQIAALKNHISEYEKESGGFNAGGKLNFDTQSAAWGKLTKFVTGLSVSADGGYSKSWQSGTDNTGDSSISEDKQKQLSEKFAKDFSEALEKSGTSRESLAKTQSESETLSNEMRKTESMRSNISENSSFGETNMNKFLDFAKEKGHAISDINDFNQEKIKEISQAFVQSQLEEYKIDTGEFDGGYSTKTQELGNVANTPIELQPGVTVGKATDTSHMKIGIQNEVEQKIDKSQEGIGGLAEVQKMVADGAITQSQLGAIIKSGDTLPEKLHEKAQDQAEINKAENSLKDKIRSTACKMLVGESPEDTGKTIQKWTEQVLGECIPEDLKEKLQTDKGGEEIVKDAKKLQDLKNKFKGNGG